MKQGAIAVKVCAACGAEHASDALFCPHDGTPLQPAVAAALEADDPYLGQEISGHIEIRQLVGVGAMGRVYRAFQRGIDRDVAVKILHRELSANAQLVSRFTREAKVASRLSHPNVVQVLLAGQLPDRALYMVMEFLDGLSLQSALAAAGGSFSLERALHVAFQLCDAVGEAHAQGIVHRDLKPENVMMVKRGSDPDVVKVLDFGIARINWGEQSVATAAGLIFGTARYISPEGAQGQTVGPASDVYAIATLLYQMLSGRTPFEGDQAVGLLVQQIHDAPPSLRSLPRASYVPEALADVVMRNLAKDPAAREEDARALGAAILEATMLAGLSPEDIARPSLRRGPRALKMPSFEKTRQGRDDAPASPPVTQVSATPMGATVKWEPPGDFATKLTGPPTSDDAPSPPRKRLGSGVDDTLDDVSSPSMPPSPLFPAVPTHVPRTIASDTPAEARPSTKIANGSAPSTQYARPSTEYATPAPEPVSVVPVSPRVVPAEASSGSSLRTLLFVLACFVAGAGIAAGVAWRLGKLGGDGERDRIVQRAESAMYANHFAAPAGDNVRELTDDGLRRYPGDRRLLEVRARAANELVNQATGRRKDDAAEALRLARLAVELDPKEPAAKRLVEQLEAESATPQAAAAPPLPAGGPRPTATAKPQPTAAVPAARSAVVVEPSKRPAPSASAPAAPAPSAQPSAAPKDTPPPAPSVKWL